MLSLIAVTEAGTWLALAEAGVELLVVLLIGALLFALMVGFSRLFELLPFGRKARSRWQRVRPIIEALLALAYLLVCVPLVFASKPPTTALVLATVLLAAIGVSWSALRDLAHGIFIKSGELCRVGDRLAIADKLGIVTRLGYRTLTLATDDGAELFIPYTELSRHSLVRVPRSLGINRHAFEVVLDRDIDPLDAVERIKQLALSSHWSSVVREPEVDAIDQRTLRVQVFALGRGHGAAIEALVRRGLRQ